jgi:hypothetical protein
MVEQASDCSWPRLLKKMKKIWERKFNLSERPQSDFLDVGKGNPNHENSKLCVFTQPGPIADQPY